MKKFVFLILFIIASLSVSAVELRYDYYMDTGQTEIFKYCGDFNGSEPAYFKTSDSVTNMTFNSTESCYNIYLSNLNEEDINVSVYYSNRSNETYMRNATLKWRNPFYYTFKLYRENSTFSVGELKPYCNEFSYIYLIPKDSEDNEWTSFDTPILDDILGISSTKTYPNPVFWNYYDNCEAKIKLYELGNYSVKVLSSKVRPPKYIEFYDYRNKLKTKFDKELTTLDITKKENLTYSIYTSDFEISKMWFGLNILKWVLVVILPTLLVFIITRPDIALRLIGK